MIRYTVGIWAFLLITVILGTSTAEAAATKEFEIICPLDGTKFMTPGNTTGPILGLYLDLKPVGFMDIPPRLPVCPSNHFVVYKKSFTDAEKENLRKLVLGQEYQSLAKDNTSYFLLAKIYEYTGKSEWMIANAYLRAAWQVEKTDPPKAKQYMDLTLQHLKKVLSTNTKTDDKTWISAQMLSGEMERRLGRFDDAKARFLELSKTKSIQDNYNAQIVSYQLELISQKDSAPHLLPDSKQKN